MTEKILETKIRIFLSILLFQEIIPQEKDTFKIVSLEILEVKTSMYICGFHFPPPSLSGAPDQPLLYNKYHK